MVGVGYSEEVKPGDAVKKAVEMARRRGSIQKETLALVFATAVYDQEAIHKNLQKELHEDCQFFGGHTVGIISNDFLDYSGYQFGIALLEIDPENFNLFHHGRLNEDGPFEVGRRIGKSIHELDVKKSDDMLLLYDSVDRSEGYFQLNMAVPLLNGIAEHIQSIPHVAGFGMSGDMKGSPGKQWINDTLDDQQAIGFHLKDGLKMHSTVMHGCKPMGIYHTITESNGAEILGIDGKPALDAVAEILGHDVEEHWKKYSFYLTLGVNKGEKFGSFKEENYVNRLCLKVNKERRSLFVFEPDLKPGTEFQLMRRDVSLQYVYDRTAALLNEIDGKPVFAFYIDCAGRASAYSGMHEEEGLAVVESIEDIPMLGVYTGVELATINDEIRALDWTGVLCIFSKTE